MNTIAEQTGVVFSKVDFHASLAFASLAPNTRRSYANSLRDLHAALDGLPLTDETLAAYILDRAEKGFAPKAIGIVSSVVKMFAKVAGKDNPVGFQTGYAMCKILKDGGAQKQAVGIGWGDANVIASISANGGDIAGIRDAAIIAVMSDALLRISEAAAIDIEHISIESDGSGRLLIPRSKTDQDSEGHILYLGPVTVERVNAWKKSCKG